MNKKFLAGWVVVFVAWMAGSFLVHGLLLQADYAQLPQLFRTEADSMQYFPLMLMAHVIMSGAFVWIYERGIDGSPWMGQGIRFGLAVVLLTVVPMYTIYYVVQPMPAAMVMNQIVFDGLLVMVLGVIVAWMHRRPQPAV